MNNHNQSNMQNDWRYLDKLDHLVRLETDGCVGDLDIVGKHQVEEEETYSDGRVVRYMKTVPRIGVVAWYASLRDAVAAQNLRAMRQLERESRVGGLKKCSDCSANEEHMAIETYPTHTDWHEATLFTSLAYESNGIEADESDEYGRKYRELMHTLGRYGCHVLYHPRKYMGLGESRALFFIETDNGKQWHSLDSRPGAKAVIDAAYSMHMPIPKANYEGKDAYWRDAFLMRGRPD